MTRSVLWKRRSAHCAAMRTARANEHNVQYLVCFCSFCRERQERQRKWIKERNLANVPRFGHFWRRVLLFSELGSSQEVIWSKKTCWASVNGGSSRAVGKHWHRSNVVMQQTVFFFTEITFCFVLFICLLRWGIFILKKNMTSKIIEIINCFHLASGSLPRSQSRFVHEHC